MAAVLQASKKGLVDLRRNKYMPMIGLLGMFLLMYLVITIMNNLRIYFVYSSGVGPFLFVGSIILVMIFLFIKGSRTF
jgi:hypothetical protein